MGVEKESEAGPETIAGMDVGKLRGVAALQALTTVLCHLYSEFLTMRAGGDRKRYESSLREVERQVLAQLDQRRQYDDETVDAQQEAMFKIASAQARTMFMQMGYSGPVSGDKDAEK